MTGVPRKRTDALSVVTAEAVELRAEVTRLRAALDVCAEALRVVASCHACESGITLGYANHCIDCPADPEAKEAELDLDEVVQVAWEAARKALADRRTEKASTVCKDCGHKHLDRTGVLGCWACACGHPSGCGCRGCDEEVLRRRARESESK